MRQDQITLATPARAAEKGEVIVIYCSGLGEVNPAVKSGDAATQAARTANETTVTIGGASAEVIYAGVTPGFAGLYQVNARIPQSSTSGDAVPVMVAVAGRASNSVTIAVK